MKLCFYVKQQLKNDIHMYLKNSKIFAENIFIHLRKLFGKTNILVVLRGHLNKIINYILKLKL